MHAQAIRELVARDKNHPSVVLWSIANEPESDTEGAEDYFRPLFDVARAARPDPAGRVRQRHARPARQVPGLAVRRRAHAQPLLRLVRQHRRPRRRRDRLEEELHGWASEGKPIIITEYGADTLPGLHSLDAAAVDRGVPGRLPRHEPPRLRPHRRRRRRAVWNFADFATTSGIMRVDGNKKGAFTRDRQPKAAAFALRRRWRKLG